MRLTRREALGKAVRWTVLGTAAASFLEGTGGVDPKTGRCDCPFCRAERALGIPWALGTGRRAKP